MVPPVVSFYNSPIYYVHRPLVIANLNAGLLGIISVLYQNFARKEAAIDAHVMVLRISKLATFASSPVLSISQ